MSIEWSARQRTRVNAAIRRYPVESAAYFALARRIRPTALEVDSGAGALHITPVPPERCVIPLADAPAWAYHVTTTVAGHCVDAMTRADGVPEGEYLQRYFETPERMHVTRTSEGLDRP